MTDQTTPTVRTVLDYAAHLRTEADHQTAADPYAKPYRPTDNAARQAYWRATHELDREHATRRSETPNLPDLDPEDRTRRAVNRALAELKRRALKPTREKAEQDELAARAHRRHQRQLKRTDRDRDLKRSHLTPGQRIDQAIASLSVIATPGTPGMGDRIHGGEKSGHPPWMDDPARKARQTAVDAARFCEQQLDLAQRKAQDEKATPTDPDETLRRCAGYTPAQVTIAHRDVWPTIGKVIDRRRELGLDPMTGENLRDAA